LALSCPLPERAHQHPWLLVIATCKEFGITVIAYSYAPLTFSVTAPFSDFPNKPAGSRITHWPDQER
jgi:hypothetical protein